MAESIRPAAARAPRAKPYLLPELCKGCGRCIGACPKDCIAFDDHVDPQTSLIPVHIDLEACNGCGLCIEACPEPFGLRAEIPFESQVVVDSTPLPAMAEDVSDQLLSLPERQPLAIKGTHASALGALLAGCRHFYGYPITPSTEGSELMARLLPKVGGVFVQAVSEVAAINHLYGCGGAGLRGMTFTSSPGFSLMLEGISYMIGAEVPAVVVNVMRGGPGLGNIGPEQSDIKLACRGLGHGNTHAIVLAAASPQEMLDLTMLSFELAFKYRNPVVLLADGFLGQMTGKVELPPAFVQPGLPGWAVSGDREHRGNLICSIFLAEPDLEAHNLRLLAKYQSMTEAEQRAERWRCDDAEVLLVACNTPARMAKGAVEALREQGVAAGLFRPISLWPFPIRALAPLLERRPRVVVVEASPGQLEDELRLAVSRAGLPTPKIDNVQRYGGIIPSTEEIVGKVLAGQEVAS
jgi:pyruvate/2-oxoacid:ferredoxin oxidoreductase alpha subunit/NAD-dependent dihydropyrimidine dehydrogenase PreA subunit